MLAWKYASMGLAESRALRKLQKHLSGYSRIEVLVLPLGKPYCGSKLCYFGACDVINGHLTCDCEQRCSDEWHLLCASDHRTYLNLCVLKTESCNSSKELTVLSNGYCGKCLALPAYSDMWVVPACVLRFQCCSKGTPSSVSLKSLKSLKLIKIWNADIRVKSPRHAKADWQTAIHAMYHILPKTKILLRIQELDPNSFLEALATTMQSRKSSSIFY